MKEFDVSDSISSAARATRWHRHSGWGVGLLALTLPLGVQAASYDCLIEPNQVVEVRSPVEGVIDRIFVERGSAVRKGQPLFELDARVERANVDLALHRTEMDGRISSARNRLEYATRKLERLQELLAEKFVSEQARDEARAEKRLADSELKDALENQQQARLEHRRAVELLNQRSARSPFDGVVMERMLNVGELAEAGTGRKPVLKLAQINPLRVEVVLPQSAYGRIGVGTQVKLVPEGLGGQYQARVTVVDKVIDAASGMFGVRLELPNPKGAVPGGIHCAVELPGLQNPQANSARKVQ
jgi:RND family efflux transporter MFP subunit